MVYQKPSQAGQIYISSACDKTDASIRSGQSFFENRSCRHRARAFDNHVVVFEKNERSRRTWKRLGFIEEGLLRDEYFHEGAWHNMVRMGLLETQWPARTTLTTLTTPTTPAT